MNILVKKLTLVLVAATADYIYIYIYIYKGPTHIDVPLDGADRVGGQLGGDKECPFSGVTKLWQSWEEGAGKPCSECGLPFDNQPP